MGPISLEIEEMTPFNVIAIGIQCILDPALSTNALGVVFIAHMDYTRC